MRDRCSGGHVSLNISVCAKLGKFHPALLGRLHPALTLDPVHLVCLKDIVQELAHHKLITAEAA